jgi:hypothetical protein
MNAVGIINMQHPISCPFCKENFYQLDHRNNHVIKEHKDKVIIKVNGEGKWVWWQPKANNPIECQVCRRAIGIREAQTYDNHCEDCWHELQLERTLNEAPV